MRIYAFILLAHVIIGAILIHVPLTEALCPEHIGNTVEFDGTCDRQPGDTCNVRCMPRFDPYEQAKMNVACLKTNQWDGLPGPCYKKTCQYPRFFKYGELDCVDGTNQVLQSCNIQCPEGFVTQSNQVLPARCNLDTTWMKEAYTCIKPRCIVAPFYHMSKRACNGYEKESICKYFCEDGYEIANSNVSKIKCVDDTGAKWATDGFKYDGIWDEDPGICRRRTCPAEHNVANGFVDYIHEDSLLHTDRTYSCDPGYKPQEESIMEAKCEYRENMMQWSSVKDCIRRVCQLNPVSRHGTVGQCSDNKMLDSICVLTCNKGYMLPVGGVSRTQCTADLTWKQPLSDCIPRMCAEPTQDNGHLVSCTDADDHTINSWCNFVCDKGYQLPKNGIHRTECRLGDKNHMVWQPELSHCELQECPMLHQVNGYEHACTAGKRYFGHECIFKCNRGYKLPKGGTRQAKCIAAGDTAISGVKWSAELTPCEVDSCTRQPRLHFEHQTACTDGDRLGSVCTYACDSGAYVIATNHVDQLTCTADNQNGFMNWHPTLSGCLTRKGCYDVHQVNGHLITCSRYPVYKGTVCSYACNNGYKLPVNGIVTIRCIATQENDGELKWDKELTKCEYDSCEPPKQPFGEQRVCTRDYKLGSVCHFQCNKGFTLPANGIDHATCISREDGAMVWDTKLTTCIRHTCQRSIQEHGLESTCTAADRFYLSSCIFTCENGYELPNKGIQKTMCTHGGDTSNDAVIWDEPKLTECKRRICPNMNQFKGHTPETCTRQFGSTCQYTCDEGYELWDNKTQTSATCVSTANGPAVQWDKEVSPCRRKDCAKLAPPNVRELFCSNSYKFESVCRFECYKGWAFPENGTAAIKCSATNVTHGDFVDWAPELSLCERRLCSVFNELVNADLNKDCDRKFQTNCTVVCYDGYVAVGDGSVTCVYEEYRGAVNMIWLWDETFYCEKRVCPHTNQSNGYEVSCTDEYKFESICAFKCEDPFILPENGNDSVACSFRRNFAGEGVMYFPEPTPCARRSCGKPERTNAKLLSCTNDYVYESTCVFGCTPGYGSTDNTSECDLIPTEEDPIAMQWTFLEPCQILSCPEPVQENGFEFNSSSNYTYQSICTFHCDIGYYSPNLLVIECVATPGGVAWNTTLPACIIRSCDEPDVKLNARVVECSDNFTYQSGCLVRCDDGFHMPPGLFYNTITCTASRKPGSFDDVMAWSVPKTECFPRSCDDIGDAKNGYFSNCSALLRYGSICQFQCHIGSYWPDEDGNYTDTVYTTKCIADTTLVPGAAFMLWDQEIPVCKRFECEPISQENGHLVRCTLGFQYGTICYFECNPGYAGKRTHYNIARCRTILDGVTKVPIEYSWNVTLSKCTASKCPPSDIRNGSLEKCTDGHAFGSKCVISCDKHFETVSGREEVAACEEQMDYETGQSFVGWTMDDGAVCVGLNECRSNPCMNAARCVDHDGYYTCECGFWQSGTNCEKDFRTKKGDGVKTQEICEGEECSFEPKAHQENVVDNILVGVGISAAGLTIASLVILQVKFAFFGKIMAYVLGSLNV